ncbi:MAG: two-component regulator propeller domain-containing protein, partial [Acidobacteriota bacterium]
MSPPKLRAPRRAPAARTVVAKTVAAKTVAAKIVLLAGLLALADSGATIGQTLPIRNYSTHDGLAHDRVNQVVRDSHGYLWFATRLGLSQFDGSRFETFRSREVENVRDVLVRRNGDYWVATSKGVFQFLTEAEPADRLPQADKPDPPGLPQGQFVPYPLGDAFLARSANTLFEDGAGALWVGTRAGIFRMPPATDRFERLVAAGPAAERLAESEVVRFAEGPHGRLWVATRRELYVLEPGSDGAQRSAREVAGSGLVSDLFFDARGRLWLGTARSLLLVTDATTPPDRLSDRIQAQDAPLCSDEQLRSGAQPAELSDVCEVRDPDGNALRVTAIYQAQDQTMWIAADRRLLKIPPEPEAIELLTPKGGLRVSPIFALSEDLSGNLWIGYSSDGIARLARSGFLTYALDPLVTRLVRCGQGELYFVAKSQQIYRQESSGAFSSVNFFVPEAWRQRFSRMGANLICDSRGAWWIRTDRGVLRYP